MVCSSLKVDSAFLPWFEMVFCHSPSVLFQQLILLDQPLSVPPFRSECLLAVESTIGIQLGNINQKNLGASVIDLPGRIGLPKAFDQAFPQAVAGERARCFVWSGRVASNQQKDP
jgi:hypothetical protein